jgi:hypothetical protein
MADGRHGPGMASFVLRARAAPAQRPVVRAAAIILGAGASLAVATVAVALLRAPEAAPAPVAEESAAWPRASALAAEWIPIPRPVAFYGLDPADVGAGRLTYAARRRSLGGGREDMLTINAVEEAGFFAILRLHRPAGEAPAAVSLFVQTARDAARDGLTLDRLAASQDSPTRFGSVESAEATIVRGDVSRDCLAFRLVVGDDALRVGGLLCGAGGQKPDRTRLVCLLDGISLLQAEDPAIRQAFAARPRPRRSGC